MGIYFKTVAAVVEENKQEPLYFNNRWWDEFATWMVKELPEIEQYIRKFNDQDMRVKHPSHMMAVGVPLYIVWTKEDCRSFFNCLASITNNKPVTAPDFWQFTSLIAMGVIEDGITCY